MRPPVDEGSTSPTLLSEVSDWQNHSAWLSFRSRYDPLLRNWCRGDGVPGTPYLTPGSGDTIPNSGR